MIVAQQLRYIAEKHTLLPAAQHGCRRQHDTTTALELLTEQVHTTWGQGHDKVATLLSLDTAAAFPNMSHNRLLHNLRRDGVPSALLQWTTSFLADRQTSLVLGRRQSATQQASTGIPQGSPVSPILFLFFNKDLVNFCARSTGKVSGIGFGDDVNILVVGKDTESNCRTLERVHHGCTMWACHHGAAFAPHKYELMHLTRSLRQFNMTAGVNLEGIDKEPQQSVRILRVLLDSKLRWGPHVKRTAEKVAQQGRALTATAGSTWGATFAKAQLIYSAVVRPAITYGVTIWAPTEGLLQPAHRCWIGDALECQQQGCLRTVTGSYKATSQQQLEAEAAVPPLRAHITCLQLQACARMEASGVQAEIQEACARIQCQLALRRGHQCRPGTTPGQNCQQWAKTILWPRRTMEDLTARLGIPLWSDGPPPPPRHHHAEHPPSTVSLAGIPAGRTMVLGALAPTAWRPPTNNTDAGPGPQRRRQLEAQQDAVLVGPPATHQPLEGAEQYSDAGPHRQDWTGGIPLQTTGTWLPHTGVQLWSAVGDSQTCGSRLCTPSPSAVKPVSSSCHH